MEAPGSAAFYEYSLFLGLSLARTPQTQAHGPSRKLPFRRAQQSLAKAGLVMSP